MTSSLNSWLFDENDLAHTPSRADGISYDQEMYERAFGVDLIVRVGSIRVSVSVAASCTTCLVFCSLNTSRRWSPGHS